MTSSRASAQSVDADLASVPLADVVAAERAEGEDRLRELEAVLERDREANRKWRLAWVGIQSALVVGSLGWLALEHDTVDDRAVHLINAGGSTVGLIAVLLAAAPALRAPRELAPLPAGTPEQRAERLRAAEELVARNAKAQAFNTGWFPFVGSVLVGVGMGAPLWLIYDRELDGAVAFVGSIAVGTLQVLTLPTHALEAQREAERKRRTVSLAVTPSFGGLTLLGRW